MRDYEVVYIFDSTLEDEEVESKLESHHERLLGDGDGEVTALEDWGKRQLAYPIEDRENGRYVVAQFTVEPERLEEFERVLELDGDLLRHLVVLHEGELPAPPSARRPEAGPEEEGEGAEEDDEDEEPEEPDEEDEEEDEDKDAEDDEDEGDEDDGEDGDDDEDDDEDEVDEDDDEDDEEVDEDEEEDDEEEDVDDEGGEDEDDEDEDEERE